MFAISKEKPLFSLYLSEVFFRNNIFFKVFNTSASAVMKQNVLFTPQTFSQKFLTNKLFVHNKCVQADSGARQPLPELYLREAPGAGDPAVHSEARDAPRPRLQR